MLRTIFAAAAALVLTVHAGLAALPSSGVSIANVTLANVTPAQGGAAGRIIVSARFGAPAVTRASGDVLTLAVDGLPATVEAGMPRVPVRTVKVALPRGMRLKGVRAEEGATARLAGTPQLNRSSVPYSWRDADHANLTVAPAPRVPARYPATRAVTSVQVLHHVPVAIVNVYPVITAGGACEVASDVQVTLDYEADPALAGVRALTPAEAADVRALVENPEVVPAGRALDRAADGYDYLILSNATLIGFAGPGGFADLQANLLTRGMKSKVVDVATIAKAAGKDLQDKIRTFIRAEYDAHAIRFVLLAADGDAYGDGAVIPARRMTGKVNSYDGSWHVIQNDIPADLYYGCLDADFDGNGNGTYGEPTDGANGGDVDLLAEVTVGRMTMKTTADLKAFVAKTIAYAAGGQGKSALLMGEALFPEMNLYGDDYMNQLVGACTDHAYTTNGYAADWKIDHLYDREHSWNGASAQTKINGGAYAIVHHLGHSNTDYNMRMYSSRIKKLTNAKPFFYYTQGCFPGDFTENDCFIELLVRSEHAAVAAVANTCYGLGPEDPQPNTTTTPGASQMLHRRFVDCTEKGCESLARANQASKEAFIGLASAPEIRWVFWDANYFGDPSLKPPR